MTVDPTTVVLGLPIPSRDPVFLAIVGVHVLFGLAAVSFGFVAMLSRKGPGRHANWGVAYVWSLGGVAVTMGILSVMRWPQNVHLSVLGVCAMLSAWGGLAAARRHWPQWPRLHLAGMGTSYIFLLTAFYVDNGRHLPLWRAMPSLAFWLIPAALGVPLIVVMLLRHPVMRDFDLAAARRVKRKV